MARNKHKVVCNYHYHYMMPFNIAPMETMAEESDMPYMYDHMCPMPDYYMDGSHTEGNPHGSFGGAFGGAFGGSPFFFPFGSPFFFRRRFFRSFFPFFFFPFF